MFGVALDEGLDERCFADAWWTNHGDDERGRFFWEAVDERDVQALLFDLRSVSQAVGIRQRYSYIVRASSLLL